eukprot:CAMPEP_0179144852 /NCGR_PEP_ID=MMETSP0796-20121207/69830_1 /TAXON_ID=73915 /ORGANISM="Pyrodinium bahamense, Strain pbaha01" /LENGTH=43 /DNA_ID= /DNA_START= /DNA_END= /DNA_ORIENTATION=
MALAVLNVQFFLVVRASVLAEHEFAVPLLEASESIPSRAFAHA